MEHLYQNFGYLHVFYLSFYLFITDQIKKSSALEFIPGIIVRFGVNDPIDDEKKIKQRIRAAVMENVNYVDAKIGANEYFVRCAHSDQAKTLSNAKILGNAEILSGMLISFVLFECTPSRRKEVVIPLGILPHVLENMLI